MTTNTDNTQPTQPVITPSMSRLEILEQRRKELEIDLAVARKEEEQLKRARLAATKRQWVFTFALLPEAQMRDSWMALRPESGVTAYRLSGAVVNKEECLKAGHGEEATRGGSMVYLFNTVNGKIIKAEGGGNIYINHNDRFHSSPEVSAECREDSEYVFASLEALVKLNPKGGNCTEIILAQRHFMWR